MSENVRELTSESWDEELARADAQPVLVDFWAPRCGPCRALAPVLEQVAEEFAGQVRVGKLDVDQHPQIAARYGIQAIPTLLVFREGRLAGVHVGALAKAELVGLVRSSLVIDSPSAARCEWADRVGTLTTANGARRVRSSGHGGRSGVGHEQRPEEPATPAKGAAGTDRTSPA